MYEQLYILGLGLSLAEKIEKAIANLRFYEEEALKLDPEQGYYVCDSFGKDSSVIVHLAKRAGVKHKCHHNLTTLDPPELIQFGRAHHAETIIHRPTLPMLKRLSNSPNPGPPTRLKRWCCAEYKETAGLYRVKVFGVRAAESPRRKAIWKMWQRWKSGTGFVLNPILFWSTDDIWRYHQQESIPYCRLYDEGYKRLGCIGCPMRDAKRAEDFARWPQYERAWKRAFQRFWANWNGNKRRDGQPRWFNKNDWRSWEDLWDWWMREKESNKDDDCQMGLW